SRRRTPFVGRLAATASALRGVLAEHVARELLRVSASGDTGKERLEIATAALGLGGTNATLARLDPEFLVALVPQGLRHDAEARREPHVIVLNATGAPLCLLRMAGADNRSRQEHN